MRKKALLILGLAMLIAAAGVVYAHWQETLTVDVEVNTGDIDPVWSLYGTNDDISNPITGQEEFLADGAISGADPSGPGMTPTRYTKAVADCVAAGGGTDALTVTVTNGYPSYWCTISADLENKGSVPVKLQTINLDKDAELDLTFAGDISFLACGYQLDPGDHLEFQINVHVNNAALEFDDDDYAGPYEIDLDLTWYNWNEYKAADCAGPHKVVSPYNPQYFGDGGGAGWSQVGGVCPVGEVMIGGGLQMPLGTESPCPYTTVAMVPNTVYPWWTTGANEWGIGVLDVADGGTCMNSPAYIYATCMP